METGTYSVTVWLQTLTTALKNRRHQTAHYGLSSLEARPTLTDWATNFIQTKYAHKSSTVNSSWYSTHTYIHSHMSLKTLPWWTYLNSECRTAQTPSPLNQKRHAKLNTPYYTTDVLQTHSPVPSSCHNEGYKLQKRPSVQQHWIIHQPPETQNKLHHKITSQSW